MQLLPGTDRGEPLRRGHFDSSRCGNPSCTNNHAPPTRGNPIHLHPVCHPDAKLDARYGDGVLALSCGRCQQPVAEISVAEDH